MAGGVVAVQERSERLARSLQAKREKYSPLVAELRVTAEKRLRDLRYKGLVRYEVVHVAVVRESCLRRGRVA